jgi:haloacid dehalogenase superfamily, subfamily IA, variant 1 with third motif having Dx(3-4)D or Dx(3-4)E
MNMKQYFDSLFFDMDGTLWDAVPSYCKIWEYTLDEFGLGDIKVTREELDRLMGKPVDVLVDTIVTRHVDRTRFLEALDANEDRLMPVLGGRLYPGVKETIRELAHDHKLFMVSNCSPKGAVNFMAYSGLTDCFTDSLTYGQTHVGKDVNIATLVSRYGLASPLYVGDTQGDADASHRAGVPIAWAAYGFGHVSDPDYIIKEFSNLIELVKNGEC